MSDEEKKEEETVLYFAIGSMMNKMSMKLRGLTPLHSVPGEILDYDIGFFGSGGMAVSFPSEGKSFHGVLHTMTSKDMLALDKIESVYDRTPCRVKLYDGQILSNCYVYGSDLLQSREVSIPTERYLQLLITGAEEHGVKESYIDYLKSLPFQPRTPPSEFLKVEIPSSLQGEDVVYWTEEQLQKGDGKGDNPLYFAINGKVMEYIGPRDLTASGFYRFAINFSFPGKRHEVFFCKLLYDPKYGAYDAIEDITEEHANCLEDRFVRGFYSSTGTDGARLFRVVGLMKQAYRVVEPLACSNLAGQRDSN